MNRSRTLFIGLVLVYGAIVLRLFYWQIIHGERLRADASSQHYTSLTVPAIRGAILDSNKSPFVINQPAYLVFAEPRRISSVDAFLASLKDIIPQERVDTIRKQLADTSRVWVPIAHKVPASLVSGLMDSEIAGLGFEKEPVRFYPEGSSSAHLLGFVGSDTNGLDQGYFGLEGYYDRQLRGSDGMIRLEKDAHGRPILLGEDERIEPEDGRNIILTIDKAVQHVVEKRLTEGIQRYGAKEGNVVVMDPKTGGILAMASYPSYDPATYASFDRNLYGNPVVASTYEPGSTFKALIMAIGIQEKVITPDTQMNEDGPVVVGPNTIRTWNNEYHGMISMTKVLEYSSNVGMVFIARKLGLEKMLSYIKKMGFGEKTGVDLQDEASAPLRQDDQWREIDMLTASFGQGIAVTPIQMVRAVSAIANGGILVKPHVVSAIQEDGKTKVIDLVRGKRIFDAKVTSQVTTMMVDAVDNGEAKWAKPAGYRIAGKTGTAQIPVAGHYDETKTIASFVGFAPADNPKFVMLVTLREPSTSQWGSETAAPLFFSIAKDLFTYWNMGPQ